MRSVRRINDKDRIENGNGVEEILVQHNGIVSLLLCLSSDAQFIIIYS